MTKSSEVEKINFQIYESDEEVNEYFQDKCGGVYKWWRE